MLFIGPGTLVYEGMVIGEYTRAEDLEVNIVREKKLTNMRKSTGDELVKLTPPTILNLEQALEFCASDECVEVTPENVRIRKAELDSHPAAGPSPRAGDATEPVSLCETADHRSVSGGATMEVLGAVGPRSVAEVGVLSVGGDGRPASARGAAGLPARRLPTPRHPPAPALLRLPAGRLGPPRSSSPSTTWARASTRTCSPTSRR